jgi:FkbM family methyltransferase
MRKFVTWLSRSSLLRRAAQRLHLHDLLNWYLRRFPVVRKLPGSGIVYRATSLESIPLGVEMFGSDKLYRKKDLQGGFSTFADLGCNVGYFTCLLAHFAQGRKLQGLMIDANPAVVKEAKWHAEANRLSGVFALQGIVGESSKNGQAPFYLYASNICSSSRPVEVESLALKGDWTEVKVPCLNVETIWNEKFGNARCQLLKVDVEGSELDFLKTERTFLRRVDSILLEWHKWRVELSDVQTCLREQGFELIEIFEEDQNMGTCFFKRKLAV